MTKLKLWDESSSWEDAEELWEERARQAAEQRPLKGLRSLPKMVGIVPETARNLKWKSLRWMLTKDHQKEVWKGFWRHPLRYGWAFLRSLCARKSYRREGDFFFYGVSDLAAFEELLQAPDSILVVGFSYCHKPFECPAGRFTPECIADASNPVCQQCFIGKCQHAIPEERVIPLIIPTVHYIGGKIFDIVHAHPGKEILFIITACEMTLEMFGDWGNMAGIRGIGVRLDGRICNTMEAFALSEEGIKPGLTVVLPETQKSILELIRKRRDSHTPKGSS